MDDVYPSLLTVDEVNIIMKKLNMRLELENIVLSQASLSSIHDDLKTVRIVKIGNRLERFTQELVDCIVDFYESTNTKHT